MGKYLKISILLLLSIAIHLNAEAKNAIEPDFAFPQKVSQRAEENLKQALKENDGNAVVRSLIDYSIAQSLINTDSIQSIINKIEQVAVKEKNPCTKALLNTLLCQIYSGLYSSDALTIERRANINAGTPLDIAEWSKKDFENKVFELCDAALIDADALKKAKLSDYRDIIKQNSLTPIYYPTLYDFVASSLIEYIHELSLIGIKNNILPLNEFLTTPISNTDQYTHRVYSIYKDVESFHKNDIAPLIYWDLMRIDKSYDSNAILRDDYSHLEQRDKAIQYLYDTYSHSEYASLVLIYQWEESYRNANAPTKLKFYNLLKKRLSQFPAYSGNCDIQNILNHIEQQKLNFRHNQLIAPNDTLSIYISNTNCSSLKVEILRLPDDIGGRSHYSYNKGETPQVYKSFDLSYRNEIPFFLEDTLKTTISQPGYYSIIVYNDLIKKDLSNLEVLYCSELTSISANRFKDDYRIWVINAKTGKVINNADINIFEQWGNMTKKKPLLTTKSQRNGIINIKTNKIDQYYYTLSKGEDKYAPHDYFYISDINSDTTWTDRATCFTSLPLYHQGDIVDWSAVIYSTKGESQKLATNKTYTISFRDANYMQIDTAVVTTDDWGRVEGKFTIPTDRLTGKYSITIIGQFNRRVAGTSFMVSDYKLPTFDVKISDITKQENGKYLISGEVRAFSGFALSDATIALDLKSREYQFFNNTPFSTVLNDSTATDANGKFSFSIALPNVNAGEKAIYKAEIVATAPNGESHETNKTFTNGNSFFINAYGLERAPIEVKKSTKLDIKLSSISGTSTDGTIYYSIINNNEDIVKSGSFAAANPVVDWSDIASGEYEIRMHSIAPTATDTITSDIRLYRLSDALPPIDEGIWIQHNKYSITKDNSVEFYYGSTLSDGEILYVLHDNKKIYDQRWIKTKAGIHKSRILLPKDINEAIVDLIAVKDYKCYNISAKISRANANNGIKINAQSFRDKITPGSDEQWTFSVTDTKGNGKESAIIMDMYSIAIEKLNPHNFNLQFYKPTYYGNISTPYFNNNSQYLQSTLGSTGNCIDMEIPQFNTYSYSLINIHSRYENVIVMGYSPLKAANRLSGKVAGYAIVEDVEAALSDEKVMYEVVETKKLNLAVETIDETIAPNIPLREDETPLAFFRPMLTTDTLGNLTYSFTVPNANTTWLFNAIAYDKDFDVAHFARNVIANKPIMVQPNLPRFLRNGDKATIKASVMNNSDSTMVVTTIIELFNPSTAKNIAQYSQIDTIPASQSALASVDIKAPIDATMIGYRIKSYCNNFGDGEQSLIAILPATSPVIESTTFYMGVDQKSYTMTLPSMPAEARVTLEFCENPTWYAVTALPGLNKGQSRTSTSAAMAIYSASIADGILRQNPQIASALYQWQHSDKTDSTLVSMLSRNEDLKNMLLSTTPWVEDANNDTERMARLSLLFNKKEIKASIDKNIHLLATLQRSGGGWAWIAENDKASSWATLSILEKIGHMKKLGFLPDSKDFNSMIENAIKYIDAEYTQLFKKHPKGDYSAYVFIRDMFPEYRQSTAAKKVTNATIQLIVSNWKQYSLEKKATSAIILNNNGYNSTAREILNSITEFSQSTTSRGMWWPTIENDGSNWGIDKILSHANILDAYYQITPNNRDIDKMRQWLIINKEANDWGNSAATSYVIYTLLNTGTRWAQHSLGCEIKLNDEDITPSRFDNITGYIKTDISALSPSNKKLTIAKHGQSPSWGAVYRRYNADMSSIEAVDGNDISIKKTLLKKEGDSWVETDEYKVGDIVKVQLTIKVKRDIEYVTITDERAACFEPTEQLPRPIFAEGICFYRENRDDATNIFVNNLPKGTYLLTYDMYVNNEGIFASGIATIQSQYAPQITAHSAGNLLNISAQ